jgi:hypothetical protein
MGRPTGVVTAVGAPIVEPEPPAAETVPDEEPEPSSRRWMWVAILLRGIAAVIGVVMIATSGKAKASAPIDAGTPVAIASGAIDARVIDAGVIDAGVIDAELAPDAAIAIDARAHAIVAPRTVDAREAIIAPPPDAAPAPPPPGGAGTITFTADPFATILVDGHDWSSTPRFNVAIPAGRHHVQLVNPETGATRVDRTIDVRDGDHVDVHP